MAITKEEIEVIRQEAFHHRHKREHVLRLLSEVERQRGEIEELNSLKDLKRMNQSLSDLCDTLQKKLEIADGGLGGLYNRAC